MDIVKTVEKQREFYNSGKTRDINYRIQMLEKFNVLISERKNDIADALKKDLGKSYMEGFMCETGLTQSEISYQIKHIKRWSKSKRHITNLANFHSKSFSVYEPYGVVLIMSPWNYPFMLTLEPLAGAIAAGNCCVLKPSAYSPATSAIIRELIAEVFPPEYVSVVEGGRAENTELLNQRFDYIFFTGGVTVGKLVMEKASKNLTPVTLELGGKSPCIIEKSCDLKLAARRVAFGKYLNCGQTCVAPDYFLVDRQIKDEFIEEVKKNIKKMYGENPLTNDDYGKIINEKHFIRINGLIDQDKVVYGGRSDSKSQKIEPTIMDNVNMEDPVMGEEIFGPVLPVIPYDSLKEAEEIIGKIEKPLAFYIFTKNKEVEKHFLKYTAFGGGCVNDTIMHLTTPHMGFGGVGYSGMGSYHGKKSFETFSHEKSVLKKYGWIDMPMRYAPYNSKLYLKIIEFILR